MQDFPVQIDQQLVMQVVKDRNIKHHMRGDHIVGKWILRCFPSLNTCVPAGKKEQVSAADKIQNPICPGYKVLRRVLPAAGYGYTAGYPGGLSCINCNISLLFQLCQRSPDGWNGYLKGSADFMDGRQRIIAALISAQDSRLIIFADVSFQITLQFQRTFPLICFYLLLNKNTPHRITLRRTFLLYHQQPLLYRFGQFN